MSSEVRIGFIGQGWIGKNYANDFENRGFTVIRYALEEPYVQNKDKIKECDVVLIAVPTPTVAGGVDTTILERVLPLVGSKKTVVIKSTISPGTTKRLQKLFPEIYILHSPEFLVEDTAAHDAAHPDRNIIGVPFWSQEYHAIAETVMQLLAPAPYSLICDSNESELIKYAHNVHGYLQVVFSNMLFDMTTSLGSSWSPIKDALLHDPMMSHYYLDPYHKKGRGAGGDCFIKDFEAFIALYDNATGDEDGVRALRYFERKNTKLLVGTKKDISLLQSVYGKKMHGVRLLIITQKIDKEDGYFGFFHTWVEYFATLCEHVAVLSLEVKTHDFPENVTVISMGKERGRSLLRYLYIYFKTILSQRSKYDIVFAHMSPWYAIIGSPIFALLKKKLALWYVHKHVDLKLRIAHWVSDTVFTATKESFGIQSQKVKYLGQAVVVDTFKKSPTNELQSSDAEAALKVITVGRITRIKGLLTLVDVVHTLVQRGVSISVTVVGEAVTDDDKQYKKEVLSRIEALNVATHITLVGSIPHHSLPEQYHAHNLAINLCPTGGMDKVVLESMAASLPTVVANEAFRDHLGPFVGTLLFKHDDIADCAEKLIQLTDPVLRKKAGDFVQQQVERRSDLKHLIGRIVYHMASI